jgi:hypothetical protein
MIPNRLLKSEIETYIITKSLESLNKTHWNTVVANRNIYLTIPYLESLVTSMRNDIELIYVIAYNCDGKPLVAGVFQLMEFIYKKSQHSTAFCKNLILDKRNDRNFSLNILVCGNMFATGENGFLWSEEISKPEAFRHMNFAAKQIKKDKQFGKKLSLIIFKEFWPQSVEHSDVLKKYKFKDFKIDVNMVLSIHPKWKSMKDYLQSMKTKFRTKANGAFKKSGGLLIKSLSYTEIQQYEDRITELFSNVLQQSSYSYGITYPSTFVSIKKALGDAFSFRAVFKDDIMVGFSTGFVQNNTFEANYVGLDYSVNFDYAVYQRLLYDYVEQAIDKNVKELHLGRTSELIKSALGAEPVDMKLYAKHKAPLSHLLMSSILHFISPSTFELRKPFKANFNNSSIH